MTKASIPRIGGKRRIRQLFIKEWRDAKGLSAAQLGERCEVSRETIWRWENEQWRLTLEKIAQLADALGIEPDDFNRLPTRPSLDAMVKNADDAEHARIVEIVRTLTRKAS